MQVLLSMSLGQGSIPARNLSLVSYDIFISVDFNIIVRIYKPTYYI